MSLGDLASTAADLAAAGLCAVASLFAIAGTAGAFRFRDPLSRLQASGLAGTTAVFSVLLAALAAAPSAAVAARVIVIMGFFLVSSPTATHIIARFAWRSEAARAGHDDQDGHGGEGREDG